jgi:hypothetical protein
LFSFLSSGLEPVALFIIDVCEDQAMKNQSRTPAATHGMVLRKPFTGSMPASGWYMLYINQKTKTRAMITRGKRISNTVDLMLFFHICDCKPT